MADHNELQNNDQWDEDRKGKITASEFKSVMSKGRGSAVSETALTYMCTLIAARRGAIKRELKGVKALDHGNKTEGLGIGRFEWEHGPVEPSGFVVHPAYDYVGGSPDGLYNLDSGIEVKCPENQGIHVKTVIRGECPKDHIAQVQGLMWITGRPNWWFVSYCPQLDPPWDYFEILVERDNEYIATLESTVVAFEESINKWIKLVEGSE